MNACIKLSQIAGHRDCHKVTYLTKTYNAWTVRWYAMALLLYSSAKNTGSALTVSSAVHLVHQPMSHQIKYIQHTCQSRPVAVPYRWTLIVMMLMVCARIWNHQLNHASEQCIWLYCQQEKLDWSENVTTRHQRMRHRTMAMTLKNQITSSKNTHKPNSWKWRKVFVKRLYLTYRYREQSSQSQKIEILRCAKWMRFEFKGNALLQAPLCMGVW